jgi:hypothetical protein
MRRGFSPPKNGPKNHNAAYTLESNKENEMNIKTTVAYISLYFIHNVRQNYLLSFANNFIIIEK